MMTHGEIVKKLIEDNNTNISDIAKVTGINRTTIYSIMFIIKLQIISRYLQKSFLKNR